MNRVTIIVSAIAVIIIASLSIVLTNNALITEYDNGYTIAKDSKENSVVIEKNKSFKTTKSKDIKNNKKKKAKAKNKKVSLGTFKVTGYCACAYCCGKTNGITASGTHATAGRTIAADTNKYPFGTKLIIDGHTYTVEDRGGAINGNKIDIYFSSHQEALQWGVKYITVYKK